MSGLASTIGKMPAGASSKNPNPAATTVSGSSARKSFSGRALPAAARIKAVFLVSGLFAAGLFPSWGQTIAGAAAGDFYSAFAKMGISGKRLGTLEDLKPFIPGKVLERLKDGGLVYRAAFIGFAANQHGIITGITSSAGFAETLNALTGFLMVLEESGEPEGWTVKEISARHGPLLASSWKNANPSLFAVMLEAYCSYKQGRLWQ